MVVISAIEKLPTNIDLSGLLEGNQLPTLLESSRKYFDIDFRDGRLVLVAGGYIGTIPLTKNLAIDVKPKFDIKNLTHLIAISNKNLDYLPYYWRQYDANQGRTPQLFQFLCQCLVESLKIIEQEGLYRSYSKTTKVTANPKGRFNLKKTLTECYATSDFHKVAVDYFTFGIDNVYNRLIRNALLYCIDHLRGLSPCPRTLLENLVYYYNYFSSLPYERDAAVLYKFKSESAHKNLPQLRQYYDKPCALCEFLLEGEGLDLRSSSGALSAASFVINMSDVFEKYLLNLLKRSQEAKEERWLVLDGNDEGRKYLFNDSNTFDIKPDIVIKKNLSCIAILDAKYKGKLTEQDRYQIISHATAYCADSAILVSPSDGGKKGLVRLGTIGAQNGLTVYCYYFDLGALNLEDEEKLFIQSIKDIVVPRIATI